MERRPPSSQSLRVLPDVLTSDERPERLKQIALRVAEAQAQHPPQWRIACESIIL